jgi:pimeloyl-ACP methyl ester carboxylesterase
MFKRFAKFLVGVIFLVAGLYFLGPRMDYDPIQTEIQLLDVPLTAIESYVAKKEDTVTQLKEDNEAMIIWADSIRQTEWSLVYLHGFSASRKEGNPIHRNIASRYGMNLYLSRLSGHGIDDPDSFLELTPSDFLNSAKEAIAIGQLIGKNVVVMSCSTGGTLAIPLAAENPEMIDALIFYSPNIEIYDPNARLLGGPWGMQLAKMILGDYRIIEGNIGNEFEQYWTSTYRTEGVVALQYLLNMTMKPSYFEALKQPYFLGYYYKDDENQDKVVSVEAMINFDEQTSTPSNQKRVIPFSNVGNHVMAGSLKSDDIESVQIQTQQFMEEVIGLTPLEVLNK